jgi:hypothetical protein
VNFRQTDKKGGGKYQCIIQKLTKPAGIPLDTPLHRLPPGVSGGGGTQRFTDPMPKSLKSFYRKTQKKFWIPGKLPIFAT